jgi:hypothetical protein
MVQELVPVDDSVHRPARLRGGAAAAELAGAALAGGLLEELPSNEKRSLPPLQAASSAVQTRSGRVAMRDAMKCGYGPEGGDHSAYQNVATVSGRYLWGSLQGD